MTDAQRKRLVKFINMGLPLPIAITLAMSNDRDIAEALMSTAEVTNQVINTAQDVAADIGTGNVKRAKKKVKTAAQRAYSRAFKEVSSKYKLKSGKWKKGGFKAAVKAAHKLKRRYM